MVDDGTRPTPADRTVRLPAPGDDRTTPTPPPDDDRTTPTPPPPPQRAEATAPVVTAPPDVAADPDPGTDPDDAPDTDPDGGAPDTRPTPGTPRRPEETGPPPRRRRQTLTFTGLLGGVLVLGLLAFAVLNGTLAWPFGGEPTIRHSCPAPTPTLQAASLTRVRVLNASDRRGLALQTARELQRRGFKVPEAPDNDRTVRPTAAAVLRHGPDGLLAARTLATQVKGAVSYQQDDRMGELVDLVLGPSFALVDAKAGVAAIKNRPAASPTC